jgi:hypothetical protein
MIKRSKGKSGEIGQASINIPRIIDVDVSGCGVRDVVEKAVRVEVVVAQWSS